VTIHRAIARRSLVWVALLIAACGAPATATGPTDRRAATSAAGQSSAGSSVDGPRADRRELAADATFADLASAARAQDDLRDQDADAACLLRAGEHGFRLEADLAVAVRPLPAPEDDLDARLAATRGPVAVLTRSGIHGRIEAPLGVVSIATTLPGAHATALVLFLTDQGLYVRRSDREDGERDASRIDWALSRAGWDELGLVAVVAEAGVPLAAIADLLGRLPESLAGRVTLGVALAAGTRLPAAPQVAGDDVVATAEVCEGGLPELAESDPIGELAPDRIRAGLQPLARAAEVCVGTTTGAGAAGGRATITARIAPDGRVAAACVSDDSSSDATLRACLVAATRQLAFDPPSGFVDFALPLALEPGRAHRQTAICR
jgi:hypothetical protein